ncbi:hypothetical protein EYR38_000863 [Pleurotus pulmonarius]|nr:hypothetical protein EYR38_000863 [Pleurotus pulmonarius]
MANTVATRSPPSRRTPSSPSPTPTSNITRGATARSAASTRTPSSLSSNAARRASIKAPSSPVVNGETRESLSVALKQETEQREQLLVQLQDKDQTITNLGTEIESLTSVLHAAETRLNELYAEQSRSEAELVQHMDVAEKLRAQVRELEKEKRDLQRRYNEQTATFEAERQAFYDNEQHLKSRIQSLTQARKRPDPEPEPEPIPEEEEEESIPTVKEVEPRQDFNDPEAEPAEMTSMRLELSTLSTSYTSLQSTLVLLQSQLVDLKRVNNELQEDNEGYMILLREKTLSGQFNLMRQVGGGSDSNDDDDREELEGNDDRSLHSTGRSTLNPVDEEPEEELEHDLDRDLSTAQHPGRLPGRTGRRRGASDSSDRRPPGESLADLPITGPGLDLAAELGRAENKDLLEDDQLDDQRPLGKAKRSKKGTDSRKVSASESGGLLSPSEVESLRTEVKSLKDANKALSLYASKIIDRIVSQGGFERVLAVDYDEASPTPVATTMPASIPSSPAPTKAPPKPRPQSAIIGRSSSNPTPSDESRSPSFPHVPKLDPKAPATSAKAQRRSMSFDWKNFSLFSAEKKPENSALRPLTLKPGASPVTGARKLDTHEDEDDRKERERLNATMKLMGIQPSPSPIVPPSPAPPPASTPTTASATPNRRFSLFGFGSSVDNSDASSVRSTPSLHNPPTSSVGLGIGSTANLTQEALEQAEAVNSLAALDAQERQLSADMARGNSGGFTEIAYHPSSIGNVLEMRSQAEVGDLEFAWVRQYGATFKTGACWGKDDIFTCDPRALQHIFQTSGYHYPKRSDIDQLARNILGKSIVSAVGDEHQRHSKIMSPAFSPEQLHSFLPLFQNTASRVRISSAASYFPAVNITGTAQMAQKWKDLVQIAAFDYQFGALESTQTPLFKSLENLFSDALLYPTGVDLLFTGLWEHIPTTILQWVVECIPTKETIRFRTFRGIARSISKGLIEEKASASLMDGTSRDLLSVLGEWAAPGILRLLIYDVVRANLSEDPKCQLDEDEMLSQMAAIILAGHETTASTLTWLLYELSRHPQDQNMMREEIRELRAKLPRGTEFTMSHLDSMTFTNACVKEALRLYPVVPMLARTAGTDDVIPLALPIVTKDGETLTELAIHKGQSILVSVCAYNRLPSVWGSDAEKWNPRRFLDMPQEKQTSVGMYANLMTFSAGIRGCIGWRFALIQLQAHLIEVMEEFEFALPEGVEILKLPAGVIVPMVKGKMHEGSQLPLQVSLVEK